MLFSQSKLNILLVGAILPCSALAGPIEKRARCPSYTIIDIRGTFEMQGASKAFVTMNKAIFEALPGGHQVSIPDLLPFAYHKIDQNPSTALSTLQQWIRTRPRLLGTYE
ncbi:hypothetical protein E4T44_02254 [Aureobasidium sp. EXF-8845]|nr:hypothetical protein E4T44_02254 [Aureobasidium sp. EXF-8845]KAI4856812.1 hypothetical protein E4T45_01711 [Aureobasidium sp. EXF-8846]